MAKQVIIPGTDSDRNKALDKQIELVVEVTDNWKALGVDMKNQREKLVELMVNAGVEEYRYTEGERPVTVRLVEKEQRVTLKKDAADGDDE